MTEKETKMILAILRQNYKNAKIEDPQAEVQLWLKNFGKYPVQIVRIAVEWHMKDSEFWPTTSAMNKLLPRAEIYAEWLKNNEKPANALEAPAQAKVTAIPDGMSEDEFIDKFIGAQIEWEKEMWPDDDNDATAGFLPYEK